MADFLFALLLLLCAVVVLFVRYVLPVMLVLWAGQAFMEWLWQQNFWNAASALF